MPIALTPAFIPRPNSLSSAFMMGVTLYRNDEGVLNKIQAQLGYAIIFVSSFIETVAAAVFTGLLYPTLAFSDSLHSRCVEWLESSAFTVGWSFVDFILNPFADVLVADESSARRIFVDGNVFIFRPDAVI
ncbi:MAG: hypothetical protein Tsb0021_06480 [Chlamydiales bacterium]